ncbi:MAG: hypothetical protein ABR879_00535 [Methanomassiliicoccales archaeon]
MTNDAKSRLLEICHEYEEEKYSSLGLNPLMAYTVSLLAENGLPTSFEYVVVAAYRMFPMKFGLTGFTEMPDAARINRALLHLTPKYQNWLSGNGSKGYVLNEMGKDAAVKASERLSSGSDIMKTTMSQPKSQYDRERRRILSSPAFQRYKGEKEGPIQKWEVYDVLGAFSYTSTSQLRKRIANLITLANDAEDREVVVFLKRIMQDFPQVFETKYGEGR